MAISIGRVGMTTPTLNDPTSLNLDGDQIAMSGLMQSTSVAQAIVLRDQIRGLANNVDEPVVPILFPSGYETYEGLYRIDTASASVPAGDGARGIVRWQLTATRVGSYQAPFVESRVVVAVLSNAHGVTATNARGEVGAPGVNLTEYSPQSGSLGLSTTDIITGADGAVFVASYDPSAMTNGTGVVRYTTTLPVWYYGGCRITAAGDIVVGRQCVDSPTSWSMTNGLVRISASSTVGYFDIEWYDGSQWDTVKTFVMTELVAAVDCSGFHHLTILRNGPEACTIRLGVNNGGGYTATADVTIRRGSRWVLVTITDVIQRKWGVKRGAVEAATALTGGIRATSNDAAGNRYLLAIPVATTNDLVNGKVNPTNVAYRTLVGIGCEVAGSSASGNFTAQLQLYRFLGQAFEVARVVGR